MHISKIMFATIVGSALGLTAPSHAVEYSQVQLDKSNLQFAYQQMGVKMDGRFRKFAAQLTFDPANPTQAKAILDVDLASVDAGSSDADQEIVGKPWFNTKVFPTARFVSTGVKPLGNNRYEVSGKLSIKGITQDVVAPVSVSTQGDSAVFDGGFTLRRGDFTIGEGAWAKFDIVANDVQLKFRITAGKTARK